MTTRDKTRRISAGTLEIGGGSPVSVQSMTKTDTRDTAATLSQIQTLSDAGCQLIRVGIPDASCIKSFAKICESSPLPVCADIHFDYRLALDAAAAGASKIRINPGNIGDAGRVRAVADTCRHKGIPIRVGANGGSLPRHVLGKYGGICAEALSDSVLEQVVQLERFDFDNICVAVKASDVALTVAASRLLAQKTGYPQHIGVTETGNGYHGLIKSAVGIGALLLDGIGDTLRVSLTADPSEEVRGALSILRAVGLRRVGVEIISCPTCGRCGIDVPGIAAQVEQKLAHVEEPLTVAVMGCAVNGPGEARRADCGVAGGGGDGCGLLFLRGEVYGKIPIEKAAAELARLAENMALSQPPHTFLRTTEQLPEGE